MPAASDVDKKQLVAVTRAGGVARSQVNTADVRRPACGRRLPLQRGTTVRQGVEPADPRH